ncbi:GGDEF domain-containing protein [Kordiimonas sp. SCSIO 12610]|uniref:GGDEF domain-containing protein n=1 Tax=Kordiimonas sp. SCSIO 12610 TaxID=2829597 RepID=UPI002109B3A0|nr:GGDEF domain-containing protein [Kordiimonas sp. SCSIO 12610]UTW54267.1 GGDEF domain-containing protein [Kordiimonas sp. SCSIO 12610]
MTNQAHTGLDNKTEINPYVSKLASKLVKTAASAEIRFDSTGWQLITEVLSFAASAEQRMAEQQDRIDHLEQLSVTDELTGIRNRRGLKMSLGRLMATTARYNEEAVLGFIDLDGFKQINDTYGHAVGDQALRQVAKILKTYTRSSDIVARIAGDEFAVILTRCEANQGIDRMRNLQRIINEAVITHGKQAVALKCSMGIKSFSGLTDPETLISAADVAMYADKEMRKSTTLRCAV